MESYFFNLLLNMQFRCSNAVRPPFVFTSHLQDVKVDNISIFRVVSSGSGSYCRQAAALWCILTHLSTGCHYISKTEDCSVLSAVKLVPCHTVASKTAGMRGLFI